MNCPQCNGKLKNHIKRGKLYHRCSQCVGFWFDKGELVQLKKEKNWFNIDYRHKDSIASISKGFAVCPRDGVKLQAIEYEQNTGIKVDVCPECEGLWLDAGEVVAIHEAEETWIQKLKEKIDSELTAVELFIAKIGPYLPK